MEDGKKDQSTWQRHSNNLNWKGVRWGEKIMIHASGNFIDDKIVTESTAKEELVAFSIRITSYHASANIQ